MSDKSARAIPPLLRAPPIPGLAECSLPPPATEPLTGEARTALFQKIREARVGGAFWADPPATQKNADMVVRLGSPGEQEELRQKFAGKALIWVAPSPSAATGGQAAYDCGPDIDPWAVLDTAKALVAHGDDEWIALARIANIPVHVLSPGPFGDPSDTRETLDEKTALALRQPLRDLFAERWLTPEEAILLLAEWRRVIDGNRGAPGQRIVAAIGMSWWKRAEIRRFLWVPGVTLKFCRSSRQALSVAKARGGALAVWPSRISASLLADAEKMGVPLVRVEDGFVRSAGLGSNLVPPSSVIVDRQGIHFDPSSASDLETILATTEFSAELLERAAQIRSTIVEGGISKYARAQAREPKECTARSGRRVVLVPGQVENDMSVLAGGNGMTSNLELLRRARAIEPEAEIWWRPHPDVDAGHRAGAVKDAAALEFADRIVREDSMAELLDTIDAVHTLTSLTGFEALLRGRDVTCHGTPFYAGWGLTSDLAPVNDRRGRHLQIDELVAGVLLLYPRYLDPVTGLPSPPEVLIQRMAQEQMPNRQGWIEPVRRAQGWIMSHFRSRRSA